MGYRLNIAIIKGLPEGDIEATLREMKLDGFIGRSRKQFTIGETKKLSQSQFDNKLRFGFYDGCTLITSNLLAEDFFRPFLTEFALKLLEVFPKKDILYVSVVESINLCGYNLIIDNNIRRCRVDLDNKIAQYDNEDLLIGKPILDEPQVLDIDYVKRLSLNLFGFVPWSEEISNEVLMNENVNLSSELIKDINNHLTEEKMLVLFSEIVGAFLLESKFKYLKTKKVYVRKLNKHILIHAKPYIIMRTLFCRYMLLHSSKIITHKDLGNFSLASEAELKDDSTGLRILYNYDAIPNRHAKTVKKFKLYMNEIKDHFKNTVSKDIDRIIELITTANNGEHP